MASFNITFTEGSAFSVGFGEDSNFDAEFDSVIISDKYSGEYEFTPTRSTQTVGTAGLLLSQNITINPIPSSYGSVSQDGTTHVLTIS